MRLVFAGTPDVALPGLTALLQSRHEVCAILTRPDAPAGRGRRTRPSPVREAAEAAGLPVLAPERLRDPAFLDELRELRPDCCPVIAFGALVPRAALDVPRLGWVNLHFSVLPAWRGAAPVQHAIMAGDTESGATVFVLEEGLDTGPVLGGLVEPLGPRDTAGQVLERLAHSGADLLVRVLDAYEDGLLVPQPQPVDGVSHAPKVTVADARVDLRLPAHIVERRIRGCTPQPGAWTTWRGERLRLDPVEIATGERLPTGTVRAGRNGVLVGTGSDAVRLTRVQPAGRGMMPAADWARGVRDLDGAVLGEAGAPAGVTA